MESESLSNQSKVTLELFVLSFLSLFIELLVIRWLCADVRMFSVFRVFPLVTCFIGLGVGFGLGKSDLFKMTLPAMVQLAVIIKFSEYAGVYEWRFPSTATYYFQNLNILNIPYILACLLMVVLLLTGPFAICVCVGARLGVLFNQLKPLSAYAVNLAGAIIGSIAFGITSYLRIPPEILLAVSSLVIVSVFALRKEKLRMQLLVAALLMGVLCLPSYRNLFPTSDKYKTIGETFWSPYQRLDLAVFRTKLDDELIGLNLAVNHAFYQYFFSDSLPLERATSDWQPMVIDRRRQYSFPFTVVHNPKDVLILGAGTGQNIASALANGAETVDAVDIDPVILKIGKKYNPAYSSAKVHAICDDARHYCKGCQKKYDLIIFSLLDSQAVVGQGSSVRLDTYVYTQESVRKALTLLKPDGVITMYFCCLPWITERLYKTVQSAAGYAPLVARIEGKHPWGYADNVFLIGGPIERKMVHLSAPWQAAEVQPNSSTPILTDNWPYLYVRPDILDVPYISVVALCLIASFWAGRKLLFSGTNRNCWQLLLLGAAFMLLELHAISLLSLVFGSTWMTSAIVINGILVMIFIANLFVLRWERHFAKAQKLVYLCLFAAILISYLTPTQLILSALPGITGDLALTLITILPLGVAGLVFPIVFAQSKNSAKGLAFNLFGAMIGGLLEYLSNYFGIRNLELIGLAFYVLSMLLTF